jgi:hypothetical protein
MGGLFPQDAAGEKKEQELDTDAAPDEGTAATDENEEMQASGDEDADPEAEATSEPFLTLTVEGKSVPVGTKEEAIALAQKGTHYTQEMQKLREAERQFATHAEQVVASVRQQETQYASALQMLDATYGYVLGKDAPDWNSDEMQKLKTEKPSEYLQTREQWDQLTAIRSELARLTHEQQATGQKQFQEWVTGQQAALAEKRPEWTDPARRQQDWGLIREYATAHGVTEQELGNLFDHRFWMILHDAARYRQAEAAGKTKRETVTSKTVAPGSGNVSRGDRRLRAERERLKTTGDPRAAGNLLQDLMTRPRK